MFPVIPKPQELTLKEGRLELSAKIKFLHDAELPKEGYRLEIDKAGVTAWSSTAAGAFYAEKTLEMLQKTLGYYPYCSLTDAPKCEYRGVMLDVGRYFYSVQDIKKLIDSAAALKLNVFHWHLTEDQGWRPEISAFPRLVEIGSKRAKTNWFPIPNEGRYTQDEMRDVVAYAHQNHMIVIPEVDVPGHVRGAIAAYSELSCFNRKLPVANHFGVKHDILCAGKEFTYQFLYTVFTELTEIFTDGYFNLGADEAVKTRWKLCPDCQKAMKEQGLSNEDELQTYFLNRLNREFFKERKIKPVIWMHGTPPSELDKDFVLIHYGENTGDKMAESAKAGYTVISGDSAYFYFDFPHELTPLSKTYAGATAIPQADGIIGGTLSIWTEYIPRMKTLEKRAFPRILAGAEVLWTKCGGEEYVDFVERAESYTEAYGKGRHFTSVKRADRTTGLGAWIDKIWWARRPLHWEGLGNLIDNMKVQKLANKIIKK